MIKLSLFAKFTSKIQQQSAKIRVPTLKLTKRIPNKTFFQIQQSHQRKQQRWLLLLAQSQIVLGEFWKPQIENDQKMKIGILSK